MKRIALTFFGVLLTKLVFSQYCNLAGQTPYAAQQPGITNFKLNTINRSSGNSESWSAVLVNTGLTTTLTAGQTYTISISHSEDATFFPGARNNLRVWLDYNSNFSFTDAGETILLKDLEAPATTYTATFIVPSTVTAGSYRLRATAKMSVDAGHSLPTSCNVPADPIGYHGEMEDYTIVIEGGSSGQSPVSLFSLSNTVCVNTKITPTNNSTGSPTPTYSWTANPATGVIFTPNNTSTNPQISFPSFGNYVITCIASNSVSSNTSNKTVTVNACNFVGLNKQEVETGVLIGPNPISNELNINIVSEYQKCSLSIIDCYGKDVFQWQVKENSESFTNLNLSAFKNGIYTLIIYLDNKSIHKQIVIYK